MTLSVAMCTYNGAKYVREQLESILNQDLRVDEIVVCDDGSTDGTWEIVNKIAVEHNGVDWTIRQNSPNLGVVKNFEMAMSLCKGDIIFLSDQDDVWHRDKTSVIENYFQEHPKKDVVFTDANLIDGAGKKLTEHSMLDSVYLLPNMKYWNAGLQYEILASCNRATGATMALRRRFIPVFEPMVCDSKWCLHDEQITMAANQMGCLGLITERLIDYRQHEKNAIGVPKDNWVYSGGKCLDLLDMCVKPRVVKDYSWRYKNLRMALYSRRSTCEDSRSNKLKLTLLLPLYWWFYGRYWWRFYKYDIWRIGNIDL